MPFTPLHPGPPRAEIVTPREVVPGHGYVTEEGVCSPPWCCGHKMADDGDCECGCCDDYRCETCGRRVRVEWPD